MRTVFASLLLVLLALPALAQDLPDGMIRVSADTLAVCGAVQSDGENATFPLGRYLRAEHLEWAKRHGYEEGKPYVDPDATAALQALWKTAGRSNWQGVLTICHPFVRRW